MFHYSIEDNALDVVIKKLPNDGIDDLIERGAQVHQFGQTELDTRSYC